MNFLSNAAAFVNSIWLHSGLKVLTEMMSAACSEFLEDTVMTFLFICFSLMCAFSSVL